MPKPQRTEFEGAGGHRLAAVLDLPDGEPVAQALFAHCFTCTKDLKAAHWIGQTLAGVGIAMLRFDFAGLGQSEGDFAQSNLSSNVADLEAAAAFLRRRGTPPTLLVGHSLGGAAMLAAARSIPGARAVCTIAAPFHPAHIRRYLVPAGAAAPELLELRVAGRTFRLRRQFLEDLERHDLARQIAELDRPLLVVHAPGDAIVEVAQAELIFAAAQHPKSFFALEGADHLLSQRRDAELVGRLIALWAERYLA